MIRLIVSFCFELCYIVTARYYTHNLASISVMFILYIISGISVHYSEHCSLVFFPIPLINSFLHILVLLLTLISQFNTLTNALGECIAHLSYFFSYFVFCCLFNYGNIIPFIETYQTTQKRWNIHDNKVIIVYFLEMVLDFFQFCPIV